MTFTSKGRRTPPNAGVEMPAALLGALQQAAAAACSTYGVPKIYFARAFGNRLHYLTGYGEETYLPAVKELISDGLWVFIGGAARLTAAERSELVKTLRAVVAAHCPAEKTHPVLSNDRKEETNR
ncbi:hypothetical protein [Thermodesulfitimonas sp.]